MVLSISLDPLWKEMESIFSRSYARGRGLVPLTRDYPPLPGLFHCSTLCIHPPKPAAPFLTVLRGWAIVQPG